MASRKQGIRFNSRAFRVLSAAFVVATLLVSCTRSDKPAAQATEARPTDVVSEEGPPEGAMLLFSGDVNGAVLLVHGTGQALAAGGFVGYDISPDGTTVIATREERLSTGISYNPELVLIDTSTDERTVLARSRPREEFNGPMKWSPDGTTVAYVLVRYSVNPAKMHPGPVPEQQTICVLDVQDKTRTCFPGLRRVFDFDWAPDGKRLVVTGPGPLPMHVLDPATGRASSLVALEDPVLGRTLRRSGLGNIHPQVILFSEHSCHGTLSFSLL
jgi:hypothetical protein